MSTRPDRIDVEMASEYLATGRAIAIDARPDHSFARAVDHIDGAVHVAAGEGARVDQALGRLPRELLWIVYCDEPAEAASAAVARRARALGLEDASVLEGGLRAWKRAGLPTAPLGVAQPPA
jgi:rhodanese-related sulfurtransferase